MTKLMTKPIVQHRLHLTKIQSEAIIIYQALEAEFEEDGIAVSLFEVDEKLDLWCASIYVMPEESNQYKTRIASVLNALKINCEIETEVIYQTDWVEETLRQLSPVRAGRFVIHGSHDKQAIDFNDIGIEIDAGLAFGTGHHGTTAGCLEMLEKELKRRTFSNSLDLGTGSGVLAIALAKATKTKVLASDIDPVSTIVAKENARLNGVGNFVSCVTATGFNHPMITANKPYDLIIANILARPLQQLAHDFSTHLAPGATVILSGLLPHQKARILAAFTLQKLHFVKAHIRDGWLTLVLRF